MKHDLLRRGGFALILLLLIAAIPGGVLARLADAEACAAQRLHETRARRLLIDLTGAVLLGEDVAASLGQLVGTARLLGAQVALVGIRPGLAPALVDLHLEGMPTYRDLELALR